MQSFRQMLFGKSDYHVYLLMSPGLYKFQMEFPAQFTYCSRALFQLDKWNAVVQLLRNYAASRKVAGAKSDGVNDHFQILNPSSRSTSSDLHTF